MKSRFFTKLKLGNEDGAVLIFVVLAIVMFISFTALAIDSGHMVMVKNELQNAADAGALAGAALLFDPTDGSINAVVSDEEAETIARANPHAGTDATDSLDVLAERGHWSFSTLTFTPNSNTEQLDGWEGMSAEDLDEELAFINAVKVTTTRENTATIFAGFFGMFDTKIETDAVAYIGFASTISKDTVDIPFAICLSALATDGAVNCGVARASNEGIETGGWTNFSQDGQESFPDGCDSVNSNYMKDTILGSVTTGDCSGINPDALTGGGAIGSTNGVADATWTKLVDNCFAVDPSMSFNKPWKDVTMPVVNCAEEVDFAGGNCDASEITFAGIINIDIIWMSSGKKDVPFNYVSIPPHGGSGDRVIAYEEWECTSSDESECWSEFQEHYDYDFVDDGDGLPEKNGIYLSPNCNYDPAAGSTGSYNMGIMAAIPVLVE